MINGIYIGADYEGRSENRAENIRIFHVLSFHAQLPTHIIHECKLQTHIIHDRKLNFIAYELLSLMINLF